MSKSLAARTLDRAAAALRTRQAGCLPEIVKLLRTLSANSSEVSVEELADVIQRDPIILAKVIGVANTLGYNPSGTPVNGADQAIHVIGYARIQALAMSLMLVEQTARSQSADEQKETTLLALTSGCVARSLVEKRLKLDPDRAYVFALLRNFGRIVMSTCMLEEFREADKLAGELTDDEAFHRVFGLTPVQLGRQLLKASDLPGDIMAVLRELPPTVFEVLDAEPDAELLLFADFSARLAELTLSTKLSPEEFEIEAQKLSFIYENSLPGVVMEIPALIDSATRQMDAFARTFELKGLPATGVSRLKQRREDTDPRRPKVRPAAPKNSGAGMEGVSLKIGAVNADGSPGIDLVPGAKVPLAGVDPSPGESLNRAGVDLTKSPPGGLVPIANAPGGSSFAAASPVAPAGAGALAPGSAEARPTSANPVLASVPMTEPEPVLYDWQVSIGRMTALLRTPGTTRQGLFLALLDALREGFGAPECMLFSNQPGKPDYRLTHGSGKLFDRLQMPARITARDRTVFGVCLSRNENVIVHHANDPKILPYMPGWLGVPPMFGAFALLPLSDGKKTHGIILAGWPEPRAIRLSAEQVRLTRTLLTFVCQAGARLAA